ncbi:hypothetical protein HDZ31DRAFT_62283 [Schizophyllum fasciatum]
MRYEIAEALRDARAIANTDMHRTFYFPSEAETLVIEAMAIHLSRLVTDTDEQIARLLAQKATIREQIAVHKALISPFRRLPAEVLALIFTLAVPIGWDSAYTARRMSRLNVLRVCHLWREIALGTPQIWTGLRFESQLFRVTDDPAPIVQTALERTGQLPLDLILEMGATQYGAVVTKDPRSSPAWKLLCAQLHRWRRLVLEMSPLSIYEDLCGRVFPLLTQLGIHIRESEHEIVDLPLHAFEGAPHVTDVGIVYTHPIRPLRLPSSWALTHLGIQCEDNAHGACLSSCLEALMACNETLLQCSISAFLPLPPPLRPRLCRSFIAPNVESLSLRTGLYDSREIDTYAALTTMLDQSAGCKYLRRLELSGLHADRGGVLLRILQCLSAHLEDLMMSNMFPNAPSTQNVFVIPGLLHALTRDRGKPDSLTLLPRLTRLTILTRVKDYHNECPMFRSSMMALLRSRGSAERASDGMVLEPLRYLNSDVGVRR